MKKLVFVHRFLTGYRYHAHSELQRADGLYGGLVIHNPDEAEAATYQYDQELLFLVGDWYHFSGKDIYAVFQDRSSNGNEPCPRSFLINGLGSFDCSNVVPAAPVHCSETQMPAMVLDKKLRYRVRVVNVGCVNRRLFSFAHPLTLQFSDWYLHNGPGRDDESYPDRRRSPRGFARSQLHRSDLPGTKSGLCLVVA